MTTAAGGYGDALLKQPGCVLCAPLPPATALSVVRHADWHLIRVLDAPDFPAYYRVIWNAHVAEFSELGPARRLQCMEVVAAVEEVLREQLAPTKINLAAFGNLVPHLHWHVVARFTWDSHFPQSLWGERQRDSDAAALAGLAARLPALDAQLARKLASA